MHAKKVIRKRKTEKLMKQIRRGKCNDEKEERSESKLKKKGSVQISLRRGRLRSAISLLVPKPKPDLNRY